MGAGIIFFFTVLFFNRFNKVSEDAVQWRFVKQMMINGVVNKIHPQTVRLGAVILSDGRRYIISLNYEEEPEPKMVVNEFNKYKNKEI